MSSKVSAAKAGALRMLAPDLKQSWQKVRSLMNQLPKRQCGDHIPCEDSEVASILEAAAGCVDSFSEDLVINYIRLLASNSLLELAAALICESGELAPIMTAAMTTRCVLNAVAQQMASSNLSVDLLNLEPVPTAEHLSKFCVHLEELFAKSHQKLSSFQVLQKCCNLVMASMRSMPLPQS